jgi:hypothetical protein
LRVIQYASVSASVAMAWWRRAQVLVEAPLLVLLDNEIPQCAADVARVGVVARAAAVGVAGAEMGEEDQPRDRRAVAAFGPPAAVLLLMSQKPLGALLDPALGLFLTRNETDGDGEEEEHSSCAHASG